MTTITDPDTGAAFDAPVTRHDDVGQAGEIARLRAENERLRAAAKEASSEYWYGFDMGRLPSAMLRLDAALKETSHD